jgi:uncharacterized YigZ family protein
MQTLVARNRLEQSIKRSRFVALAAPMSSIEQAQKFLQEVSDISATHNCYAWRFGQTYRSFDGDEPAGSAGRPILSAIDGAGLDQIIVVVIRYFGGIKLGVGGLVRAYSSLAAECLRQSPKVSLVRRQRVRIQTAFADRGHVAHFLALYAAIVFSETFTADGISMEIDLSTDQVDEFSEAIRDATRGRARISPVLAN